jgi:hypothetical protein
MYVVNFRYKTHREHPEFQLLGMITNTKNVLRYIPKRDGYTVVLAGDTVSTLLPALGKYKVPNVRIGNNPKEKEAPDEARRFYYGMEQGEASDFLRKYNIDYVIFGVDSQTFAASAYTNSSFLREIYSKDGHSLVQVIK